MHTYIYTCTYVYIYIYTYTHTHIDVAILSGTPYANKHRTLNSHGSPRHPPVPQCIQQVRRGDGRLGRRGGVLRLLGVRKGLEKLDDASGGAAAALAVLHRVGVDPAKQKLGSLILWDDVVWMCILHYDMGKMFGIHG